MARNPLIFSAKHDMQKKPLTNGPSSFVVLSDNNRFNMFSVHVATQENAIIAAQERYNQCNEKFREEYPFTASADNVIRFSEYYS